MKFMDEVSAFTKGVGQKAKGNYDIVAMNNRISSIQKEIRGIYTSLGEAYYALHKKDSEESLKNFVDSIVKLEAQISEVQRQLETTKAATAAVQLKAPQTENEVYDGSHGFCANCGASLPEDSIFCVKCGAKVEQ